MKVLAMNKYYIGSDINCDILFSIGDKYLIKDRNKISILFSRIDICF